MRQREFIQELSNLVVSEPRQKFAFNHGAIERVIASVDNRYLVFLSDYQRNINFGGQNNATNNFTLFVTKTSDYQSEDAQEDADYNEMEEICELLLDLVNKRFALNTAGLIRIARDPILNRIGYRLTGSFASRYTTDCKC